MDYTKAEIDLALAMLGQPMLWGLPVGSARAIPWGKWSPRPPRRRRAAQLRKRRNFYRRHRGLVEMVDYDLLSCHTTVKAPGHRPFRASDEFMEDAAPRWKFAIRMPDNRLFYKAIG